VCIFKIQFHFQFQFVDSIKSMRERNETRGNVKSIISKKFSSRMFLISLRDFIFARDVRTHV